MDAKSRTFSGTPWPALASPPVQPLRCLISQSRPCNRPASIFFSSCHSSQNPLLPLDMTFHPPQCVLRRFSWPCLDSGMVFPALALHPTWNYTKRRVQKKSFSEKSKRSKYIYNLQLCKERKKERKKSLVGLILELHHHLEKRPNDGVLNTTLVNIPVAHSTKEKSTIYCEKVYLKVKIEVLFIFSTF